MLDCSISPTRIRRLLAETQSEGNDFRKIGPETPWYRSKNRWYADFKGNSALWMPLLRLSPQVRRTRVFPFVYSGGCRGSLCGVVYELEKCARRFCCNLYLRHCFPLYPSSFIRQKNSLRTLWGPVFFSSNGPQPRVAGVRGVRRRRYGSAGACKTQLSENWDFRARHESGNGTVLKKRAIHSCSSCRDWRLDLTTSEWYVHVTDISPPSVNLNAKLGGYFEIPNILHVILLSFLIIATGVREYEQE